MGAFCGFERRVVLPLLALCTEICCEFGQKRKEKKNKIAWEFHVT